MTPQQLDATLRRHTPHEELYLQGWQNPDILARMQATVVNGEQLHVLRLEEKTALISGGKHSRFNVYPIHIHPWVELVYMYDGSCVQRVNGTPIRLTKGQALLLDQNTVHELPVLGEEDILLNLYVQRSYLNAGFFNRVSQKNILSEFFVNAITEGVAHDSYMFFASEHSRRLPVFIQEFFCECMEPSAFSEDILGSLFTLIVTELIQTHSAAQAQQPVAASREISVLPILRYIEQNHPTVTLKQAAAAFSLNPNYLSALLKTKTGSSFSALVCKQRMAAAKNLLANSRLPVTEIAAMVGYENTTFFYKKFKEHTGASPAEYRRLHGY